MSGRFADILFAWMTLFASASAIMVTSDKHRSFRMFRCRPPHRVGMTLQFVRPDIRQSCILLVADSS